VSADPLLDSANASEVYLAVGLDSGGCWLGDVYLPKPLCPSIKRPAHPLERLLLVLC
jgi:hypothetical protein